MPQAKKINNFATRKFPKSNKIKQNQTKNINQPKKTKVIVMYFSTQRSPVFVTLSFFYCYNLNPYTIYSLMMWSLMYYYYYDY